MSKCSMGITDIVVKSWVSRHQDTPRIAAYVSITNQLRQPLRQCSSVSARYCFYANIIIPLFQNDIQISAYVHCKFSCLNWISYLSPIDQRLRICKLKPDLQKLCHFRCNIMTIPNTVWFTQLQLQMSARPSFVLLWQTCHSWKVTYNSREE